MARSGQPDPAERSGDGQWTFLTNHAHVLLTIADDASVRIRDIADRIGITERSAHRIVNELVTTGYLNVTKQGRRNLYEVDPKRPLRHPLERDVKVGSLLSVLRRRPTRRAPERGSR